MKNIAELSFLYPFQVKGIEDMMAGKRLLSFDVGLGKSVMSLSYVYLKECKKVLITCPAPLRDNWRNEIKKFFNEECVVLDGGPGKRKAIFSEYMTSNIRYLIINYEQYSERNKFLLDIEFDCMILDEVHRVKNFRTKTYKFGQKIRSKEKLGLSATLLTNHPFECYAIANFIKPWYFKYHNFVEKYAIWGLQFRGRRLGYVKAIVDWKNLDKLKIELAPIVLRKTKKEVRPELPARIYKTYYVDLSTYEQTVHDDYFKKMKEAYKTMSNDVFSFFSLMNQTCNGMKLLSMSASRNAGVTNTNHNSKLSVLKDVLTDMGFK